VRKRALSVGAPPARGSLIGNVIVVQGVVESMCIQIKLLNIAALASTDAAYRVLVRFVPYYALPCFFYFTQEIYAAIRSV
jgi:hypothetical protein